MDSGRCSGAKEQSPPVWYETSVTTSPVRGVIFDLGSTLIRRTGLEVERQMCASLGAWAAANLNCRDSDALTARLLEMRLDAVRRSDADQRETVAAATIADALAGAGLSADEPALRRAEAAFFKPEVRVSRLYPWAHESLDALVAMDLRLALISNAVSHRAIVELTQTHDIFRYFNPLVTSAAFGRRKPHPDIFTHVLGAWEIPAAEAVMVGDALGYDVLGAEGVGMRSILVDIEPHPDNPSFGERVRPTARVTSLREIPEIVRGWSAG